MGLPPPIVDQRDDRVVVVRTGRPGGSSTGFRGFQPGSGAHGHGVELTRSPAATRSMNCLLIRGSQNLRMCVAVAQVTHRQTSGGRTEQRCRWPVSRPPRKTSSLVAQQGCRPRDSRRPRLVGIRAASMASHRLGHRSFRPSSIWTAVTLYSGQLVAQSECSVVTTLAPVTGWWNVV